MVKKSQRRSKMKRYFEKGYLVHKQVGNRLIVNVV